MADAAQKLQSANSGYLNQLAAEIAQIPELVEGFKSTAVAAMVSNRLDRSVAQFTTIANPNDITPPSKITSQSSKQLTFAATSLMHFENSSLYGDTRHELPRATCDFTSDPKGKCVAGANALAIKYKDTLTRRIHTATFDWTGASTGKSSATVQGHDPLNPNTVVELPTRLALSFTDGTVRVASLIIDIHWHPSACAAGRVLFDLPDGADFSAFVLGADRKTRIINIPSGVASLGPASGQGNISGSAAGAGLSLTSMDSFSLAGSLMRGGKCQGLEDVTLKSLTFSGSASDGKNSVTITFGAKKLMSDPQGVPTSAQITNGSFITDNGKGTFTGVLDDSNRNNVPGDHVTINFTGGSDTLEHFLEADLGLEPRKKPLPAAGGAKPKFGGQFLQRRGYYRRH